MPYKIIWQPRAVNTYLKNIKYLKENWSEKEIENFETACSNKLYNISNHPHLGSSRRKKNSNIRFTLINKRVALIYQFKPKKKEIVLLFFWNTYQNPIN
jgi:plasmid stabilization system protein ParE